MMQKYQNIKPVYYELLTGETSTERTRSSQICFDSTAEYKIFKQLENHFVRHGYLIDIHPKITIGGTITWKIDFRISSNGSSTNATRLALLANKINGSDFSSLSSLYVEYKGFQDNKFLEKFRTVSSVYPLFSKSIILLSGQEGAFGFFDKPRCTFIMHPICSPEVFTHIIESL